MSENSIIFKLFKILYYIVNNSNRYFKLLINNTCMNTRTYTNELNRYLKLIKYNLKIVKKENIINYIFNYISNKFMKFNDLYDLNLYYVKL